jgi:hypothetical protein
MTTWHLGGGEYDQEGASHHYHYGRCALASLRKAAFDYPVHLSFVVHLWSFGPSRSEIEAEADAAGAAKTINIISFSIHHVTYGCLLKDLQEACLG